ncbi:precorrin-6y C5,15-methyltransferase (decarboxylating) subunit CbiE [Desulfurivibrio dismutans]|uniref:precorrin-6y C5,15-methyltransferase (decarboxylating) subunit CbiE n=1 Tax=Desulfurivibrio dismutans TaxID=1398908 RepID=UPI0023DA1538|nr:precorrin-6y C5,15-methyltransferase (decarboxylating) subunit CbiE [Desulfurivibrio alkaliphilus]MDF1613352.1 precorrin-6y C5,15-methyltransferase (decarboxylating) subunit CbiE [Desulfurivibrio alkaliphilus]
MTRASIIVIGVGDDGLSDRQRRALAGCRCLIAGERLRPLAAGLDIPVVPVTPLKRALAAIGEHLPLGDVGVLASGDPLFFGIGRTLLQNFAPEQLAFLPALSTVQQACARFRLPWDDARIISLHGRTTSKADVTDHGVGQVASAGTAIPASTREPARSPLSAVFRDRLQADWWSATGALLTAPKTIIFTDGRRSPDVIAARLRDYLTLVGAEQVLAATRVLVAENLGGPEERLTTGSLDDIAGQRFAPLNIMILLRAEGSVNVQQLAGPGEHRQEPASGDGEPASKVAGKLAAAGPSNGPAKATAELPAALGLRAEEIRHSRGLITKDEVRAVTLHKLRLPAAGVFWDLGAGSGSVSLEASRLAPGLAVYAVERREEELANIKANIVNLAAFTIRPVAGEAPAALAALPDPDRIFIGGSGGCLAEILAAALPRLRPGGRVVINGVTAATKAQAPLLLHQHGCTVEVTEVSISRRWETVTSPADATGTTGTADPAGTAAADPGTEIRLNPISIICGQKQ